jgi:hypothetical protein
MEASNVATSGAATRDQVRSVAGDGFAERTSMNRVAQYFCYVSIAAGLGYTLGSGPWFAKSGAFSWVGAVSLWFVFFEFGAWVLLFTWLSYKNLKRGWVHKQEIPGPRSRGEGISHGLGADAA